MVVAALGLPLLRQGAVDVDYRVQVDGANGIAHVEARLSGTGGHIVLPLWLTGPPGDGAFVDPPGVSVSRLRFVFPAWRSELELAYSARFGVLGRHGYQGRIEPDFAMMHTALVAWLPAPAWSVGTVRLRAEAPGQEAACPWPLDDDGWYVAELDGVGTYEIVQKSAVATGTWDRRRIERGGQVQEVAMHTALDAAFREQIVDYTGRIFGDMQQLLGFELRSRYLDVFVPPASDGKRIHGASWTLGHAYEAAPKNLRHWELLVHRISHLFNRDRPHGMHMGRDRDVWLVEGLPSWMEITATMRLGIAKTDARFDRLFRTYWSGREDPEKGYDHPAARDRWVLDHDATEWLHYMKYPLIVAMLDHTMRGVGSDGVRVLFARLFERYGYHRAPVADLEAEAEAVCSCTLDRFFARYVDGTWPLWPLSDQAIHRARRVAKKRPVVARLGEVEVRADGRFLSRWEDGGDEARAQAARLIAEAAAEQAMTELQLAHEDVPPALAEVFVGLRGDERAAVTEHRRRVLAEHLGLPPGELDAWLAARIDAAGVMWEAPYADKVGDAR